MNNDIYLTCPDCKKKLIAVVDDMEPRALIATCHTCRQLVRYLNGKLAATVKIRHHAVGAR